MNLNKMQDRKDNVENANTNNQNKLLEEGLSPTYIILFKILLIIHIIIIFIMFVFFGLNHLVLFVVSMTVTIRMYLGVKNKNSNYFIKGLFLFILCFIFHAIKIIFRFILTYFIYKNKENISNLKDMNIIVTETILWIKGFDIKLNGIVSIIIIIIFMAFWFVLIILFEIKKKNFNYPPDEKEKEIYINLINNYYQKHEFNNQIEGVEVNINNNNNVNNNYMNNNANINNNTNL